MFDYRFARSFCVYLQVVNDCAFLKVLWLINSDRGTLNFDLIPSIFQVNVTDINM
jgi:hypothetical protein